MYVNTLPFSTWTELDCLIVIVFEDALLLKSSMIDISIEYFTKLEPQLKLQPISMMR